MPAEQKNETIYTESVEDAYNCIVDLHASHGNHLFVLYILILILIQLLANFLFLGDNIFYPTTLQSTVCTDPFRPFELSRRQQSNEGAPPKLSAKPRKANRVLNIRINEDLPPSTQKRKTQSIRNAKRGLTVSD